MLIHADGSLLGWIIIDRSQGHKEHFDGSITRFYTTCVVEMFDTCIPEISPIDILDQETHSWSQGYEYTTPL